ncbi:dihydrodipicolinate synthase family protein, partial [Escherichia coli]|nr:dihydrodipicolinate synthase family protein [Escherichia coli]
VEGKPFTVYSGFDDQFLSNIANNGGGGCIGALSIIVPEIWSSLVKAANERDFDRTFALYHLIQKLMPIYDMDTNCSLILKKLLV